MKKLAVTLGFLTFSQSTKAHAFNQTDDSLAGETRRKYLYLTCYKTGENSKFISRSSSEERLKLNINSNIIRKILNLKKYSVH